MFPDQCQLLKRRNAKTERDYRDQRLHSHLQMRKWRSRETKWPAHVTQQAGAPVSSGVTSVSLILGSEVGFHLILFDKHKRQKEEGQGEGCDVEGRS